MSSHKKIIKNPSSIKKPKTEEFNVKINADENLEKMMTLIQILQCREQRIQTFKEMLTQRSDFNPEALFMYLSGSVASSVSSSKSHPSLAHITPENLLQTFQDNEMELSCFSHHIRLVFSSYGHKDNKLSYSDFLNFVFPVDTQLLKYISVTGIKKYFTQGKVSEEVLFIFICLLQEEIALFEDVDRFKEDFLQKITRKEVKTLLRFIKKSGDCRSQMEVESQNFIKFDEFRNTIKKHLSQNKNRQLQDRFLTSIFRRLSIGKANFINLEDLEFWLRPWNRLHSDQNASTIFERESLLSFSASKVSLVPQIS